MDIIEEVKYLESRYADTPVKLYDGLEYKQRDIIKTADFYTLSRYTSSQRDELGRDKPFFNVVNFRLTLAKTATEFDIKDFVATSDEPEAWLQTMLINREVYKWMKEARFSRFLNKYAYVRPKYGGVLYKTYTDDKDELKVEVCDWRNTFTDQVDVLGSTIIEKHYLSPIEIDAKRGAWDNVDEALQLFADLREKDEDSAPSRLEVWEVTGIMDENFFREAKGKKPVKGGEDKYTLQKHYILMEEDNEMIMFSSKPDRLRYRYLAWEEVGGRGLGRGVIEESEEGQVWINDLAIKQKNTMDLATKITLTTDADNVANNVLEVDDGKIFKLEEGRTMNKLELTPASIGKFADVMSQWEMQLDKQNSTFDANTGSQPPSGTPYSQTALLNRVADRPFSFRREEAGIDMEELFVEDVVPHLVKKLSKEHILAEDFSDEELQIIDESFGNKEARKRAKEALLNFEMIDQGELDAVKQQTMDALGKQGAKRHIKIPKDFFKGWEGKVTFNITNEQYDKSNILTSLSSMLTTVAQSYNPQTGQFSILENPTLSKLFGMIVDTAGVGISPIELGIGKPRSSAQPTQPTQPMQAPQMAQQAPAQPMA